MRTTLNIDDSILDEASILAGVTDTERSTITELQVLICLESGMCLSKLDGTGVELKYLGLEYRT